MRIEVTQEDIDRGMRGSCQLCPVARAIQRHTNLPVEIGDYDTKIGFKNKFKSQPRVFDFVFDFDFGRQVSPFSFSLSAENFML